MGMYEVSRTWTIRAKNSIDAIEKTINCGHDNVETVSLSQGISEKVPPLGLKPMFIHREQRFDAVCRAIERYYKARMKIPHKWIEEFNDFCKAYSKETNHEYKDTR